MKARELEENAWFTRDGSSRVLTRLPGGMKVLEGKMAIPVKYVAPIYGNGFYIPADEIISLYKLNFVRIN